MDPSSVPRETGRGSKGNDEALRCQRAWSIANARRIIGYDPPDSSEVAYADEIRAFLLDPARQKMVQGEARGGNGGC